MLKMRLGAVPLIEVKTFDSPNEEVNYCADEFLKFIQGGLQPEATARVLIFSRMTNAAAGSLQQPRLFLI